MKLVFGLLGVLVLTAAIGAQIYISLGSKQELIEEYGDISARVSALREQQAELQREQTYLNDPVNLEKELRARFNYKQPGETMVIFAEPRATTSPTSTRP